MTTVLLLITLSSVYTLETQYTFVINEQMSKYNNKNKPDKEKNLKSKRRKDKAPNQCHVNTVMSVRKVSFSSNVKTKTDSCLCYNFVRKLGIQSLNPLSNFGK